MSVQAETFSKGTFERLHRAQNFLVRVAPPRDSMVLKNPQAQVLAGGTGGCIFRHFGAEVVAWNGRGNPMEFEGFAQKAEGQTSRFFLRHEAQELAGNAMNMGHPGIRQKSVKTGFQ